MIKFYVMKDKTRNKYCDIKQVTLKNLKNLIRYYPCSTKKQQGTYLI